MSRVRGALVTTLALATAAGCRGVSPATAPTGTPAIVPVAAIILTPSAGTIPASGGTIDVIVTTEANVAGTQAAPNVTVTLAASAGSLSTNSVATDFTGHAKVTWTGSSAATITATAGAAAASTAIAMANDPTSPPANPTPGPAPGPAPAPPTSSAGPLFVDVSANPRLTDASTPVAFSASAHGYNGSPAPTNLTYAWNFGDGATSTAATPTHLFASADHWTVTVDIAAADGRTGRGTIDIVVGTIPPPTVTISSASASPASAPIGQLITFTAAATGNAQAGAIVGYSWTFGDGATANGQTVTHAYTTAGPFAATVTATSSTGATMSATAPVTITLRPLSLNVTASTTTPASGALVTFTATVTSLDAPSSVTYQWDWNSDGTVDETTGTSNTAGQSFNGNPGDKRTVTVTATAADGRTVTSTITVIII